MQDEDKADQSRDDDDDDDVTALLTLMLLQCFHACRLTVVIYSSLLSNVANGLLTVWLHVLQVLDKPCACFLYVEKMLSHFS